MIKSFEPVYKELEYLFIDKLPEYIEKINKEHNDGIIIKRFENHRLEEDCIKLPSFKFNLEEAEYSEKDRIIENTVFSVSFEIKNPAFYENATVILWRYFEAINRMIDEIESDYIYQINEIKNNKILIRITE